MSFDYRTKMIRKFKIKGLPTEKELQEMPFGQQIEPLRAIAKFKESAKSTHLSQKRQSYTKAIREFLSLHPEVTEYFCAFHASKGRYDDSFEFWYR